MTDLSKFEDEIYAMKIEYLLGAFEYDLQAKANAAIGMMLERVDELVATGEPITEKQLEQATAQLNEVLATELGGAMVDTQAALREVAAEQGEVVAVAPFFTAGTLMRQAEMDGTTMAEWFKRSSPSRYMEGLIREIQRGIEAGWERHRSATEQATRRLAATAIETGLWSHSTTTLINNWTAREFKHVTRRDEMVCELCGPTGWRDLLWCIQWPTPASALPMRCSARANGLILPAWSVT